MNLSKVGRLVLTALLATTGVPAVLAATSTPMNPVGWDHQAWQRLDESLREIVERGCAGPQSVIVRTKPGYRGGLRDSLKAHGNPIAGEFASINAVAATVSCSDLQTLANFHTTLSVSSNPRVTTDALGTLTGAYGQVKKITTSREAEGDAAAALQTPMLQTLLGDNFQQIRAQQPVASMGIAIIDSGIEPGPDFGDRITAFYDFTNGDIRAAAPSDAYGHGTHVAGLAASKYVGVNPSARLIGLKVLDGNGQGNSINVLRAIEFAVLNKDLLHINVLNLSLGHPIFEHAATDPLVQAVEAAVRSGLVVVLSAGNFGLNPSTGLPGYAGIASPGNAPSAFSIGAVRTFNTATRTDDRIALFSSRGPSWYDGFAKPDFSAPGQNLLSVAAAGSTLRLAQELQGNTGNYMRLNGTSMAAGVVSGMAALILQANPALTPNALKAALEYSAVDVKTDAGVSADFLTQGAGAISGGALTLAASINATAAMGAQWLTAAVSPSTAINGESVAWVQRVAWGNYVAYGSALMTEQRPAWALDVVWGDNLDDDDNIVWGNVLDDDDNIVWGNSLDEDDNIVWGNNVVWGNSLDEDDNIVWGNSLDDDDNIVWGNSIVWGDGLIGLSLDDDDNIVWGNSLGDDDDNIVWGNLFDDNVVWGNSLDDDDNIVWGNSFDDAAMVAGRRVGTKASSSTARRTHVLHNVEGGTN